MSARDEILQRIRTASADAQPAPIARGYDRAGALAHGSPQVVDLFAERVGEYRAYVHRGDDVPAMVREALTDVDSVVVPPGLDAAWVSGPIVDDGKLNARDLDRVDAVVTAATAACARTGTIALDGSPDQGRRALSLVPDRHVCVVRTDQVVETVPEMLALLDGTRPLTFISGPSATSDIELERIEGVHGPRNLHVILAPPTNTDTREVSR